MKFNSVKRGNFSGLAGHVNKATDQVFAAARETAVDNTAIAKEAIKGRSLERRAAMKAEGQVAQAGLKAFASVKDTKNKIESQQRINDIKRPAKRMAGIVGGLGAIAGGYVGLQQSKEDKADRATLRAERDKITEMQNSNYQQTQKDNAELIEWVRGGRKGPLPGADSLMEGVPDPKPSAPVSSGTGAVTPKTTPVSSTGKTVSSLSAAATKGLAAIRRVESGPYGYNAYNLGGKTEFDPIGSGSAKDGRFGKNLTDMTIGEIKQLGASGKIHATGAYQFTHNTGSFGEAASFAGLNDNDLFTPANQDKMAYEFGKKYGWERWSGLKKDSQARDEAIFGFQN